MKITIDLIHVIPFQSGISCVGCFNESNETDTFHWSGLSFLFMYFIFMFATQISFISYASLEFQFEQLTNN